jgi:hypothetical protein
MAMTKEYWARYYAKNKEIIKARARAWYRCNRAKVIRRSAEYTKRFRKEQPELSRKRDRIREKRYKDRYPWVKTYRTIGSRCSTHQFYVKQGIRARITVTELKRLWFRDKAYLMKHPTIDRKNRDRDYTFTNCQYIELKDNLKRRVFYK